MITLYDATVFLAGALVGTAFTILAVVLSGREDSRASLRQWNRDE